MFIYSNESKVMRFRLACLLFQGKTFAYERCWNCLKTDYYNLLIWRHARGCLWLVLCMCVCVNGFLCTVHVRLSVYIYCTWMRIFMCVCVRSPNLEAYKNIIQYVYVQNSVFVCAECVNFHMTNNVFNTEKHMLLCARTVQCVKCLCLSNWNILTFMTERRPPLFVCVSVCVV